MAGDVVELKPLSAKHQVFVNKYLELWNGTQAYLAAYPGAKEGPARTTASHLLANPNIQGHIKLRLSEIHMSADEALSNMARFARGDVKEFIDVQYDDTTQLPKGWDVNLFTVDDTGRVVVKSNTRLIKKLKRKESTDKFGIVSVTTEVELYDAKDANEKILQMHGKFGGDIGEVSKSTSGSVLQSLPADLIAPDFLNVYRAIKLKKFVEYVLKGGRGSTKSSFISLVIPWLMVNNPDVHALVLRQVKDTLRDSVYGQIKWAINELGLSDVFKCTLSPLEIEYVPTKQKIYFRGADDPANIKSIKPAFGHIGIVWFEELDQFHGPEAIRNIIQSALRGGEEAFIFKSFNPPRTTASWVNKEVLIPKANRLIHESNYLTVPVEWLGKPWIEEAEHLKEVNPKAYDHEYMGIANGTGGMVFENVIIRKITDDEIKEFDRILPGLDWGYYPDPLSFGKMHYDAARLTLYIFDEFRANKLGNRQAYDALKDNHLSAGELVIADSAEPKSIGDFREYGANIRGAEKGPDSVDYSMKWLQSLKAIIIDNERCPYHAEEFLNYELETDKNGEIISAYPDKNNHAIDDVRYATNLIWRRRGQ